MQKGDIYYPSTDQRISFFQIEGQQVTPSIIKLSCTEATTLSLQYRDRTKKDVVAPTIVKGYNASIGGVDKQIFSAHCMTGTENLRNDGTVCSLRCSKRHMSMPMSFIKKFMEKFHYLNFGGIWKQGSQPKEVANKEERSSCNQYHTRTTEEEKEK